MCFLLESLKPEGCYASSRHRIGGWFAFPEHTGRLALDLSNVVGQVRSPAQTLLHCMAD